MPRSPKRSSRHLGEAERIDKTFLNINNVQDWDDPIKADHEAAPGITVTFGGETVGEIAKPLSVYDTIGNSGAKTTKKGFTFYPVDSEFSFYISEFTGAEDKVFDGDYAEGWAGNVLINGI